MDHRIRRIIEDALPVDGVAVGQLDYNSTYGWYFKGVGSSNRASLDPCVIRLHPGKRYIVQLTGTTFEYGLFVRKFTGINPDQESYAATPGVNTTLFTVESALNLVNTGYIRTNYTYDCTEDNLYLSLNIRTRSNNQITTALLEQLKNDLHIIVEEA
jgi:hypothetical protein